MKTLIYEYGAREPVTNLQLVQDQMILGHQFKNTLVAIELDARRQIRDVLSHGSTVVHLAQAHAQNATDALAAARKTIDNLRATNRSGSVPGSMIKLVKDQERACKRAWSMVRSEKKELHKLPEVKAEIKRIQGEANTKSKAAYNASGAYWGTRLVQNAAMDAAKKKFDMYFDSGGRREKNDPNFRRWQGEGVVAVQIQGNNPNPRPRKGKKARDPGTKRPKGNRPRSTAEVFEPNTLVWIGDVEAADFEKGHRKKRDRHVLLHLRVDSDDKNKPVWTQVVMTMHRPLPPGIITWVKLFKDRTGPKTRWRVQFTIGTEDTGDKKPGHGMAAIDVGWRLFDDDSLRVAMVRDQFGGQRELRLPAQAAGGGRRKRKSRVGLVARNENIAAIQSLRDRNFEAIKPDIAAWLSTTTIAHTPVAGWRNPGRVVVLLRDHGPAMPAALHTQLTAWAAQDRHLWSWAEEQRRRVRLQRRDLYRKWVDELCATYAVIVIEDFDISEVARRGSAEEGTRTDSRRYQRLRSLACVSSLKSMLKSAARARGVRIEIRDKNRTTIQCHVCGTEDRNWDPAKNVVHTCPNKECGATWDQDVNAAENLLTAPVMAVV